MRTAPNPGIIAWAIERCGKTPEDFIAAFPKIQEWISGDAIPTNKQMQKFAQKTHVLLPHFFSDEIPNLGLQILDFRTKRASIPSNPSPELYDTINTMQSRQDWLAEYLKSEGNEPLAFIGCCSKTDPIEKCVEKLRGILNLEIGWAKNLRQDAAIRVLREAIEKAGVYVCAGSYYGNSTRRTYSVDEFRGFVLTNEFAPIIFLNTNDAKTAQLFTLVHEFAHLLFNESGVDDAEYDDRTELSCDAIAAEYLVPSVLVYKLFDQLETEDAIEELRRFTKVSEIVCLRRAKDLMCINRDTFFKLLDEYKARLAEIPEKTTAEKPGYGPTYYVLQKNHLGKLFPETIFIALKSEKLLYSDAYKLTGMTANSFSDFYKREGLFV